MGIIWLRMFDKLVRKLKEARYVLVIYIKKKSNFVGALKVKATRLLLKITQ